MKRLLALLLGGLGLRALLVRLRRRPEPLPAWSPADELKAKIAETKADEPAPGPTVDERRADVHGRAREAIDELRGPA